MWLVGAVGCGSPNAAGFPGEPDAAGSEAGDASLQLGDGAPRDADGGSSPDGGARSDSGATEGGGTTGPSPWVMGYYSSWDDPSNGGFYPVSAIDWDGLTHIAAAFYLPDGHGRWASGYFDAATAAQLISAAHAHGKKAIASIGGAGSGPGFEGSMKIAKSFNSSPTHAARLWRSSSTTPDTPAPWPSDNLGHRVRLRRSTTGSAA